VKPLNSDLPASLLKVTDTSTVICESLLLQIYWMEWWPSIFVKVLLSLDIIGIPFDGSRVFPNPFFYFIDPPTRINPF